MEKYDWKGHAYLIAIAIILVFLLPSLADSKERKFKINKDKIKGTECLKAVVTAKDPVTGAGATMICFHYPSCFSHQAKSEEKGHGRYTKAQ